jgi:two-component system sensor histidine kinase/response regulator
VNRTLVTTLLKRRGHTVTAVENGRKALAAIQSRARFDLVLMDLQMPEMGGLEATRAIRDREREERTTRLPLVALTAHAMQGDRERCLEAGMDGYLSKPIDVDELIATVERFGEAPAKPAESITQETDGTSFDERAALAYCGGERRLLKEVIGLFRSDYPSVLEQIERALHQKDSEALRQAAHRLKGAIATVGAPAGQRAAAELERMAQSKKFEEAGRAYATLRREIERLEESLAASNLIPRRTRRSTAGRKRRPSQRKHRSS